MRHYLFYILNPLLAQIALIILIVLFLIGCAATKMTTTIEDPQGKIWTIVSKDDGLVEFKSPDGTMVKVDNKGEPGFIKWYMQYMAMTAAPTIQLGNQPRDDD